MRPCSDLAMEVAELHKRWLSFHSKEAHAGLAQMYCADERVTPGATQFLCDAILNYTRN